MKKILFIIALAAVTITAQAQGQLTIHNSSNCTIYMVFDATAPSTDTPCGIQGNQIILAPMAGVMYSDAIDFETAMGWQIAGSTAPYAVNGIPSDFVWTDVEFNAHCICSNYVDGFIGDGGYNCFGTPTMHNFLGRTPNTISGGDCIIHAHWTFDNNGEPLILFTWLPFTSWL